MRNGSPLVLCYHAVSDRWPSELAVTRTRLRRQIALLLRRGYRASTFTAAVTAPATTPTLAVTFDDAYRSTLTCAYPVLAGLGVPATVFVPTDFAGAARPMAWPGIEQWSSSHPDELRCLDWDELRWLAKAGWEVGSHTGSHPRLTELDQVAVVDELERSRAAIGDELGTTCESLAYPYGAADEAVVACAGGVGYRAAALLGAWPGRPRPLAWPRLGVYRDDADWRFRAKLSPTIHRVRAAARGATP